MNNDEFEKQKEKEKFNLKVKCINEYYNDLSKDFKSAYSDPTNYSEHTVVRDAIIRLIQEIRDLKIELLLKE